MKLTVSNANITNTLSTARMTLANNNIVDSISLGNVSVTPSQISIGNSTITPAAVSVPALVLGGTQYTGSLQGGIINYQEFTANGTWYNPYANAFVNTSLTGYEQVLVMAWGGGGGATSAQSGGGGACIIGNFNLAAAANTCAVTVGLGGTYYSGTTGGTTAGTGGNTTFVINASANLVAYGGGPATYNGSTGAGGGTLGLAVSNTGGAPLGGAPGATGGDSTFGGGGGGLGNSPYNGGRSIFGGGGGISGNSPTANVAGNTIYGGAGGGVNATATTTSVFGGRGNTAPGGGGNYGSPGARGEVRVWVFGPAGTTVGAPTYTLTANTTTLYEGSSVLYTVSTTNVANGTTFYYTLNNSSTAVATDFTTAVNGSVVINGGTGTFTLTANNDTDSANEAFQIDVRTGSTTGSIVASNGSVSIVPLVLITSGLIFNLDAANTSSANSGTTTSWNDISGNGRNFTLINGPIYTSANNGAIDFDGTNDYATIADAAWIPESTTPRTFETWVNIDAWRISQTSYFISKTTSQSESFGFGITENSGILTLATYCGQLAGGNVGEQYILPNPSSYLNSYHHFALTYDGNIVKMFVDGQLVYTSGSGKSYGNNSAPLYLMAYDPASPSWVWPVNGKMAVATMYNVALTDAEILQNFNARKGRYGL